MVALESFRDSNSEHWFNDRWPPVQHAMVESGADKADAVRVLVQNGLKELLKLDHPGDIPGSMYQSVLKQLPKSIATALENFDAMLSAMNRQDARLAVSKALRTTDL